MRLALFFDVTQVLPRQATSFLSLLYAFETVFVLRSLSLSQHWISCRAAAGLSLGEYTALVFAGAMSFEDALRLVKVRAEAMQQCAEQRKVRCGFIGERRECFDSSNFSTIFYVALDFSVVWVVFPTGCNALSCGHRR